VGDAPPSVQVRLLRTLQEREVQRVGGGETVSVDVRVVAATNRPLERMIDEGTFRSDLYYRLNIFPIQLPPLRERREDIRPLGVTFLERHAASMHRKPPRVPDSAWRVLEAYDWPGNVRELDNFLARALILSPGTELLLPPLPVPRPILGSAPGAASPGPPRRFDDAVRELLVQALEATGGRIHGPSGAAALLGLRPTTLQGKLRRHRIARPSRPK
jgi:formate hydrogenlyase transcriptional activator